MHKQILQNLKDKVRFHQFVLHPSLKKIPGCLQYRLKIVKYYFIQVLI